MKNLKMMRKRKLKNHFKIGIILLGFLIILTNCEKAETLDNSLQNTIENKSDYIVPNIASAKENFQKRNNLKNPLKSSNIQAKGKKNDFFIDWDNSKIVKFKENINILYSPLIYNKKGERTKSFVASVTNNDNEIESFIYSIFYAEYSTNEHFSGDIVKFNTNEEALELYNYENGVLKTTYTFKQDKDKKKNNVSYKYIESDCGITWEDIMSMYEYGGGTILGCVEITGSSSASGSNEGSWGNPDTNLSGGSIPLGDNYSTGGSSGSTSGVNTNPTGINPVWFAEEDINIAKVTNYLISNLRLNVVQKSWVNNINNSQNVLNLYNFLKLNPNFPEAKNFAEKAIVALSLEPTSELNLFMFNLGIFQDTKINFTKLWDNFENIKYSHFDPTTKKELFPNYCAINLSHALLKTGITMSSYSGVNCWGCESIENNSQHAIRAQELAIWLKNTNIDGIGKVVTLTGENFRDYISGKKGIVFFQDYWQRESDSGDNRTGDHIDLWDGNGLASESFFTDWFRLTFPEFMENFGLSSLYKSKTVLFWEIP